MSINAADKNDKIDLTDLEKQIVLNLLEKTSKKGSLRYFKDWFGNLGDNGDQRQNYDTFARIFLLKLFIGELKNMGYRDISQRNEIAVKLKRSFIKKLGKDNIDENLKIDEELFKRKCKSLMERIKNEIKISYMAKKNGFYYDDENGNRKIKKRKVKTKVSFCGYGAIDFVWCNQF